MKTKEKLKEEFKENWKEMPEQWKKGYLNGLEIGWENHKKKVWKLIDEEIDYLKLIIQSRKDDKLDYSTEYAILKKLEELKARIKGEK